MKQLVLIDDSYSDAQEIRFLLEGIQDILPHELHYFSDLNKGLGYIQTNIIDLLLLDLEFTTENVTAASIIDDISSSILIVSNLPHFQKTLSNKTNVKGFINKSHLAHDLLPSIKKSLNIPVSSSESKRLFVFPGPNSKHISEAITVSDIR